MNQNNKNAQGRKSTKLANAVGGTGTPPGSLKRRSLIACCFFKGERSPRTTKNKRHAQAL